MTQNQLRYWELRWKQHYENILLKMKQQEVDLEVAKLNETIRHNKRAERQEDQRIILEQQKLSLDWSKFSEQKRATAVAEYLKAAEVLDKQAQTRIKQAELKLKAEKQDVEIQKMQQEIVHLMNQDTIASAEFYKSVLDSKNKNEVDLLNAEANLLKAGWGKATVGDLVAEVKANMDTQEYDQFVELVSNTTGILNEMFGPDVRRKNAEADRLTGNTGGSNSSTTNDGNPVNDPKFRAANPNFIADTKLENANPNFRQSSYEKEGNQKSVDEVEALGPQASSKPSNGHISSGMIWAGTQSSNMPSYGGKSFI